MTEQDTRSKMIASANDQFRKSMVYQCIAGVSVITCGISQFDDDTVFGIRKEVIAFDEFTEDNDPHGEHDFGSFMHPKAEKIFWKIDVFEDKSCETAAEFPEDLTRSFRVLTIMLASEY